jgi:hypothetical protein
MPESSYNLGDGGERDSVWRFPFHGGTHARIAKMLDTDSDVQDSLTALKADPANAQLRENVIAVINRHAGNLIGVLLIRQLFGQKMEPDPQNDQFSIFKSLKPGTADDIAESIGGKADVHEKLAGGDAQTIVRYISRMTGRAVGQAAHRMAGGGVVELAKKLLPIV